MEPQEFLNRWFEAFDNTPPIGEALRQEVSEIWFRIYALPSAKRYAETEFEVREILRRQNETLTELLGKDENCYLIVTDYADEEAEPDTPYYLADLELRMSYLYTVNVDEGIYWRFFVHGLRWREGLVDSLLMSIADDERENVLFISSDLKNIHHPYDGGADLFIRDPVVRAKVKKKFATWLSKHPLGL